MEARVNKNPTERWITSIGGAIAIMAAPTIILGVACAAEQSRQAPLERTSCVAKAQTDGAMDLGRQLEFETDAETRAYFEDALEIARYRREMHEKALQMLLDDPRWAREDQRHGLASAVRQTVAIIEQQTAIQEHARSQLRRLAPKA